MKFGAFGLEYVGVTYIMGTHHRLVLRKAESCGITTLIISDIWSLTYERLIDTISSFNTTLRFPYNTPTFFKFQ